MIFFLCPRCSISTKFTHVDRHEVLRTKLSIYSSVFNSKTPETPERPPRGAWFPGLGQPAEERTGHTATLRGRETTCIDRKSSPAHTRRTTVHGRVFLFTCTGTGGVSLVRQRNRVTAVIPLARGAWGGGEQEERALAVSLHCFKFLKQVTILLI